MNTPTNSRKGIRGYPSSPRGKDFARFNGANARKMGRGYLLIYNLAWRPSVPVAILQARAAPRRSIYDSTRTSNPDTNSISVIISERVSIPMDDASLAHRFHHEKRKREIERGGEVALYNRNYWKLNIPSPWFESQA